MADREVKLTKATTPLEIKLVGVLRRIAREYKSADQLLRNGERDYGISGSEALVYAYDNIQCEAARAIKGVRIVQAKLAGRRALEPDHG